MKRIKVALLALALCVSITAIAADKSLTAAEAKDHVGEKATVCGIVASTQYAASSKGSPTFVNLYKPYPSQVFTILIWGEDLPKFSVKPATWDGKRVCATGTISSYRGIPEIVAKSLDQITFPQSSSLTATAQSSATTASRPPGATAQCRDGTYSFSQSRRGTCSHHGEVAKWL